MCTSFFKKSLVKDSVQCPCWFIYTEKLLIVAYKHVLFHALLNVPVGVGCVQESMDQFK